jgi:hypothetical protein
MMNTILFLEYLPWLREPKYKILGMGLSADYEKWALEETTPVLRDIELAIPDAPDSLQKLYANHDLRNIELLSTFFWSEPKQLEQGWGFADMSEINIVVAPSSRIEAYNAHPIRGMPGATDCLGVLAVNLEAYLEALFYGQFNKTHFISGFPDESPTLYQKTVLVAKHCSLIAGGYEYYDFWAGLLGLPPTDTVPE